MVIYFNKLITMAKKLFLFFIFFLSVSFSFGNAITITNLSVDATNQEVTFDLEWKNSWRIDSMSAPLNWDAAWVFVKFSECDSLVSNPYPDWEHGKIDTIIANNNFGDLEPVLNNGNIGIADSLGVMLRRKTNGFFTNQGATTITLKVSNLNPLATYHLRVVAIEMVYVPQGTFKTGWISNYNSFDSIQIANENALTMTSIASAPNNSVDLDATFPKGYDGFHCMKYEISNGQYATFLNSLNATQSANRYINTTSYRHRLTNTGTNQFERYISNREDRACNYIGWNDLLAYLDWAALRPMTELQYEKACRGLGSIVIDEYSWGTTYINDGNQFTGAETGGEYFVDATANCVFGYTNFTGGDGGYGPARCGIFALPTNNTREQSGATYYGIMEMTGNLYEQCVNVSDFTKATGTFPFDGKYGDGYLDATGLFNVTNWPSTNNGSGLRGGAWNVSASRNRMAAREYFLYNGNRNHDIGGRGIR